MERRTRSLIIVAAVIVATVAALVLGAVWWASDLQNAANTGKAQAEAGVRSLAAQDATAAVAHFRSASASFAHAGGLLGPDWLGSVAGTVPWVGRQRTAVKSLAAIGVDASNAGAEIAIAMQETSSAPIPEGSSRLSALLAKGRTHIDAALASLSDAAGRAAALSEDGLDPRIAKAVRSLKDALREVGPFLERSRSLLSLERYLLASSRRILVISQNNAELRPTGGFAGSYGVLNVGPQGFSLEKYTDVYTLPDPPGRVTPPPGARMTKDFGFRDANWWIDFPTSARSMLSYWDAYRQPRVDGIIALDVVAVKDLLRVFGPVRVASHDETFTADNLLDRLLYLVEVKGGGSADKKDVLVALANDLEQRVLESGPSDLARSALALATSADAKHVQFYFPDPAAQAAVTGMGWSGAIAPPSGTTDLLAVSNAMTLPGKVNIAMKKTVAYEVALRADGSAETTLVLGYANTLPYAFSAALSGTFRDYLRVYRPKGTVPISHPLRISGHSVTTLEDGLPVFVREFKVHRGDHHTETIITLVPGAWRVGASTAVASAPALRPVGAGVAALASVATGHYRLSVVRQADLEDVPATVRVSVPAGWRITGVRAWKTASGTPIAVTVTGASAGLSAPLDGDVILDVEMERG